MKIQSLHGNILAMQVVCLYCHYCAEHVYAIERFSEVKKIAAIISALKKKSL